MNAVRDYTSNNVGPHLKALQKSEGTFLAETVPGFGARTVFEGFRGKKGFDEYLYKEAAPNPTNLRDKADAFETQLVGRFQTDPAAKPISSFRTVNGRRLFFTAAPLRIKQKSCLECHTTPDMAPAAMVAKYGPDNGFGWKLNQVIAAQIVYVPASQVLQQGRDKALLVLGLFVAVFGLLMLGLNLLLRRMVLVPLNHLAAATGVIAAGGETARAFQASAGGLELRATGAPRRRARRAGEDVRQDGRHRRRPARRGMREAQETLQQREARFPGADRERLGRGRRHRRRWSHHLRQSRGSSGARSARPRRCWGNRSRRSSTRPTTIVSSRPDTVR